MLRWKNRTSGNPNTCRDQWLPWRCWFGSNHRTFLLLSALFFILGSMPEPFPSVNPPSRHTSLPPPRFRSKSLSGCVPPSRRPRPLPPAALVHTRRSSYIHLLGPSPPPPPTFLGGNETEDKRSQLICLFGRLLQSVLAPSGCLLRPRRPLRVPPSLHFPPSSLHLCIIRPPNSCFSLSLTLLTQLDPLRQINAPLLAPSTPHPPRMISLEQVLINDMQHND